MRNVIVQVFAAFIAAAAGQAQAAVVSSISASPIRWARRSRSALVSTGAAPKLEAIEADRQTVARDAPVEGTRLPLCNIHVTEALCRASRHRHGPGQCRFRRRRTLAQWR